jgi:galactosylceramidase
MHMVKVEIGGDGQSTDGTEASHMHNRDDLSCERGYEFWLLQEARAGDISSRTRLLPMSLPEYLFGEAAVVRRDGAHVTVHTSGLRRPRLS